MRYQCKCCGYYTMTEKPVDPDRAPGTFEICPVCRWEDDSLQFLNPDMRGGANRVSLNEAKENFKKFGACEEECIKYVRPPKKNELTKPKWWFR